MDREQELLNFLANLSDILGVKIPTDLPGFFLQFILPWAVMWYAVYILFEKIKIFRKIPIVSFGFGGIISFLSLRVLGGLSFWIGIVGIFALRLKGSFTKFLGLAIVFIIYTQVGSLFAGDIITAAITIGILLSVLVVLDRVSSWKERIFYVALIVGLYFYFSPLLSGQIPSITTGLLLATIYSSFFVFIKVRSLLLTFVLIAVIVVAYFIITGYFLPLLE